MNWEAMAAPMNQKGIDGDQWMVLNKGVGNAAAHVLGVQTGDMTGCAGGSDCLCGCVLVCWCVGVLEKGERRTS